MGTYAFAKLTNVGTMQPGQVFTQKGSSDLFRVIGPSNEVERFTGNRRERSAVLQKWAKQPISESRFAAHVVWPGADTIAA